ncbi:MAG TPA: thioesterase family protein [Acidimicrobiales bacterium]
MRRRSTARGGPEGRAAHRTVEIDLDIYTFDIDFAGHVSNISYIRWLEIGRIQLLADIGYETHELVEVGLAPLVIRTEIDYLLPLKLGDPVHMSLDLTELRAASATIDFRITSRGQLAATARQLGLFVKLDTGKPARVSPELRGRFSPYLQQEPSDRERLEG